jgi:hypothetical protein
MTSKQAYKEFLFKVNKNDTNSNIKVSPGQFVLIFNEQARFWLDEKIKNDQSSDLIANVQELLEIDVPLQFVSGTQDRDTFSLPEDFFRHVSSYTIASKGNCIKSLTNYPVKPKDANIILIDENNNPSFEFEETITVLSQMRLDIYKSDFKINNVYLTYYKEVPNIDIEGYINLDGKPSTNIDPILYDINVEQVLNRCAIEVVRNYKDTESFQLNQTRLSLES